jgi:hypothetical protein
MKKLAIIGLLVLVLTLGLALPAQAAVTMNVKVPVDMIVENPVTGEDVHITGEAHIMTSLTEDGAGGFHSVWHFNARARGIGETTGNEYIGRHVEQLNVNIKPPFPYEDTFVLNVRMIGPGKVPNFVMHLNMHVTINANGVVTAEVVNSHP